MQKVNPRLYNWASNIEDNTLRQAEMTARLPVVTGHVALMPDAHWGNGSTVGSVIPTESAICPSFVGVDIGCGMVAVHTKVTAEMLPENLNYFFPAIRKVIPAGVGQGHENGTPAAKAAQKWFEAFPAPTFGRDQKLMRKALEQFGSLGGGNHFFEVCLDTNDEVWLVLHSGSRGIGNILAKRHIEKAQKLTFPNPLEDPSLAYFEQGTEEFDAYITDMRWAQEYAWANRAQMMGAVVDQFWQFIQPPKTLRKPQNKDIINCHHNYTVRERHFDTDLWITRKGAIRAGIGDLGIIPGSMGTATYIVTGKGNADSYESCSHGAGRVMSRSRAKRELSVESLEAAMAGKSWNSHDAKALLDEHPDSYKSIDQVMADQADLVEITASLRQILNYKGTK